MRSVIACMNALKNSKNIAIFCHTMPDADALASAVALKKNERQIKNLLYRAKQSLKSKLEKEGFIYEEL